MVDCCRYDMNIKLLRYERGFATSHGYEEVNQHALLGSGIDLRGFAACSNSKLP